MVHALLIFAAEAGEGTSHAPFYIAGGLLTLAALVVSFIGMSRGGQWPSTTGAGRGIIGIFALLVAATMITAVVTA